MTDYQDEHWMQQALVRAQRAVDDNEVPVGAVLVLDNEIIGEGWNQPISSHNPVAHAEIMALQQGAQSQGNYRLLDSVLYVTLEPCCMCAGAMVHARIKRLVFGAYDAKTGAVESQLALLDANFHNHRVEYQGGVLRQPCSDILSNFFSQLRSTRKSAAAKERKVRD